MESNPNESSRTLWIGDLDSWMDDSFLQSLLNALGFSKDLSSIKLIKDKVTGQPLKYGFLQFLSHSSASKFYNAHNNRNIPNTNKIFKLNWAAYGGSNKPTQPSQSKSNPPETQIYVGDIDPFATQNRLLEFFKSRYPSAFNAKIITDTLTKFSKGYGFVKFTSQDQAIKAINETNGQMFLSKPLKVSTAYIKNKEEAQQSNQQMEGQLLLRQKLYNQFFSLLNDPQLKAQYQRQVLKSLGSEQSKKATLKQILGEVKGLPYHQTKQSQQLLQIVPRLIYNECRYATQFKVYLP